jgi:hypothetical protein
MSIRESIAKLQVGERLVVEERYQVNYVRALAKENGQKLRQQKMSTGEWLLLCIGQYEHATLVWLRRVRRQRLWWRRNRRKH